MAFCPDRDSPCPSFAPWRVLHASFRGPESGWAIAGYSKFRRPLALGLGNPQVFGFREGSGREDAFFHGWWTVHSHQQWRGRFFLADHRNKARPAKECASSQGKHARPIVLVEGWEKTVDRLWLEPCGDPRFERKKS